MSKITLKQLVEEKLPDDGKPWIINDTIMLSLYSIFDLFDRNKITNDLTNLKQKCLRIKTFEIRKDDFDEVVLRVARECPNLEILKFRAPKYQYCTDIKNLLLSILGVCPNIKSIYHSYSGERIILDDETIIEIARLCPNIEKLVLYGVEFTNKSLIEITNGCPKLKELILSPDYSPVCHLLNY